MIADDIDTLDPQELRERLRKADAQLAFQKSIIDKLSHENAVLKRLKFAAKSETYNAEWTPDGRIRHPSFKGLRTDKPAKAIVREQPVATR